MNTNVKAIPDGFHTVTPYLTVKGASEAIEFYKRAFGAQERCRILGPDGKTIGHAEITIGNSVVMLGEEMPGCNRSPQSLGGTATGFAIYVKDVDAAFQRAVNAGAKVKQPVENKFWGDRAGSVEDPFGHQWSILSHVEDVSAAEIQKRMKAFFKQMSGQKRAQAAEPVTA